MSSKKPLFLIISFVFFGVSVAVLLFANYALQSKIPPLPIIGKVPDFSFMSSRLEEVSKKDLDGKVWVADFIFTTCGGICPKMTENLAWIHRSYLLEKDVRLVSVTVNPDYDSPQVMKEYAGKHGADTQLWHFLTGPKEAVHDLAYKGFMLGGVDDPIFHSPKMVLVDRKSRIRGYYDGTDKEEVRKLFKDIARLMKEKG